MPFADRSAQQAYTHAYYLAHRQEVLTRSRERAKRWRVMLREHLHAAKDVPCLDCGVRYPYYVMHFDHLGDKQFNLAEWSRMGAMSLKRLRREIAKCEVVCANCHAERTQQRLMEKLRRERSGADALSEDGQATLF
jgi:hypothetical protein